MTDYTSFTVYHKEQPVSIISPSDFMLSFETILPMLTFSYVNTEYLPSVFQVSGISSPNKSNYDSKKFQTLLEDYNLKVNSMVMDIPKDYPDSKDIRISFEIKPVPEHLYELIPEYLKYVPSKFYLVAPLPEKFSRPMLKTNPSSFYIRGSVPDNIRYNSKPATVINTQLMEDARAFADKNNLKFDYIEFPTSFVYVMIFSENIFAYR